MKRRVLALIVAVLLCVQMMPAMVMAAAEDTDVEASSGNLPFTDVKPGDWFYDSVDYVYQQKIMTGMTTAYFGAAENLARAQFAAVLYRMAGEPEVDEKQVFPDVPVSTETAWYAKAAAWANENKIILGYKNGYFGPADPITREQMVVMMYRYAKNPGYDGGSLGAFPDASKVSDWAKDAMEWAIGTGIITGDQGKINPQGKVSRAVCATIIQRFDNTYKDAAALVEEAEALIDAEKYEEALVPLLEAVEMGDAAAQILLGDCYYYGYGVEQDYEEAVKYYQLAADQRNEKAQYYLGWAYEHGEGVEQDYEEAVKYYRLAADQGNMKAQYYLGSLYENGYGTEQDYEEAVKYYRIAADQGLAEAQFRLGFCFYYGIGVEQDYEESVKYCQLAADQGLAAAQNNLGWMYLNGFGVEQDYEEAVKYYQLAADQGFAVAQSSLGTCYFYGTGVEQDYEEALKYYQLAADQGNADAQFSLGYCYYFGYGVEQNYDEAVKYYQLAADQGDPRAMFGIGDCYYTGSGVEKDLEEAANWYQKALDAGLEPGEEEKEHLIAVLGEGYDN